MGLTEYKENERLPGAGRLALEALPRDQDG